MSIRNKVALWGLLAVVLIGAICLQWVRPAYRYSRMWLYMHMAEEAVKRKDYNAASLAYRKVLSVGNEFPESWKALIQFLNDVQSPEVIGALERLSQLEPEVVQHRYDEARAALRFDRVYLAEEILANISKERRNDAEALRLNAAVAMRKNQLDKAKNELGRLLKLVPDDQQACFDLTTVNSRSAVGAERSEARAELQRLAEGTGEFALPALRQLVILEREDNNLYEADRLAGKLAGQAGATVQDRLMYAQLEVETNSLSLPVTLRDLRQSAVDHPESFGAIMNWLLKSGTDGQATRQWIAELPPNVSAKPEIQEALLQYNLLTGQIDKAFRQLSEPGSQWHIPQTVLDLARRALQENKDGSSSAEQTWMSAIYSVEGNARTLHLLSMIASASGWNGATGRALSALVDVAPGNSTAWWLLIQHEEMAQNLPGLYKGLRGLLKLNPYDITVASRWVLVASLLQQGDLQDVLDVAKRAYDSTSPSNPTAATAYAFALLQANHPKEALQIINKMSVADRRAPLSAIYVGCVLAANDRREEALDYFNRSEELDLNLLPEERALRMVWKGVAKGDATSAEEVKKVLDSRSSVGVNPAEVNQKLLEELSHRVDPAEVQRIFESLKAEARSRSRPPVEVERLLREVRQSNSEDPKPAQP